MKRPLEVALKDALGEASSSLDTDAAVARLTAASYRAQSGRRRAGVTAIATLAAAVVAAVLSLLSGGSALVPLAYAGWSAVPQAATPAEIAHASRLCRAEFASTPAFPKGIVDPDHLALAEKRGEYVAVLWAQGRTTALCISDGRAADTTGGSGEGLVLTGGAQLSFPMSSTGPLRGFPGSTGVASQLFGRAAPDVRAVTLIFPRGRSVQGTVEHGWYFAWWPNSTLPLKIRAQTRTGTITIRG
jgi:hypothetical protein